MYAINIYNNYSVYKINEGGGKICPEQSLNDDTISKEEQILLHISKHNYKNEDYFAPKELTLQGISENVGSDPSYISRKLKAIEKEDIIGRKKARINGRKRKQTIFFLTEKGKYIEKEISKNRRSKK